jgi:DNA-binding HxlR family transcriptional regulator
MPSEPVDPFEEDGTQCVVILQVLRDDHEQPWTLAELEHELADVDPDAIVVALARLEEQGVVLREGEHISASPCARHLNALGFICI